MDFGVNSNLVLFKINKRQEAVFQYFVLKIKQTFFKKIKILISNNN